MSSDWVKMRTDLYRDPKVCLIADALLDEDGQLARSVNQICQRDMTVTRNVMRNVTVGALVTLWGVTRHRGKRYDNDLIVHSVTLGVLDDITDLPGFGEAIASVGWAVEIEDGVKFPNFFEEFNADPADIAKKSNAERQRRFRQKKSEESNVIRNVTVTSRSNTEKRREEKKREEKKVTTNVVTTPVPLSLDCDDFREWWGRWIEDRKARKKPLTANAAALQLAKLESWGPSRAVAAIKLSIERQWQGIYEGIATGSPGALNALGDEAKRDEAYRTFFGEEPPRG